MTPNEIEGAKERINFLSRILLALVAGIYLLIGAVGGYLLEWFERADAVWSDFAVVPVAGIVAIIVMSFAAIFVYRIIDDDIAQIRKSSPENRHE